MSYICANVNKLQEVKDVTPEIAAMVRKVWKAASLDELEQITGKPVTPAWGELPRLIDKKREMVDRLIDCFGVEYLGIMKRSGTHVYYCDAGDTYASTIIFIGRRLVVGCWGDLVESSKIKGQ